MSSLSLVPTSFDRERHLPLLLEADDAEEHRGRGSGRHAIELIAERCREQRASQLTVGTSDCGLGTIAFYRKVGFRFAGVRKGYFDDYPVVVIENGIRARDMVMFEMQLDET